ncbi:hypothetical protein [uncultured Psychroserpens sp.]|uniref:hypothetical protein n=1 Tax=uncultured Psychroserpens sp. TaxID=255436 RepID=UPI002611C3A5|nr:hypothetical protein [uncultured Psychroserpens sp.]
MERNYVISINQLADFSRATDAKKRRIIKQQKVPNKFLVAWYQLAKSRIKKTIANNGDLKPILDGIEELKAKKPEKQRQIIDRMVSLDALKRFINIKLPKLLKEIPHEVIKKPKSKSIIINGVEVIISPDVIFKLKIEGKTYIGAVKVHISKNNVFDNQQSRYISSLIYKYLNEVVAKEDEEVMKDLCLSIDVFGEKVITVPKNLKKAIADIEVICEEVKAIWNVA